MEGIQFGMICFVSLLELSIRSVSIFGSLKASSKVCAGSEDTISVLYFLSARLIAVEQEVTVFPVPPFPV